MATKHVRAGEHGHAVRVSDEAVKAKTHRTWKEWFVLLDKAGARKLPHADIATLLFSEYDCPGWWSQMIAVAYEQSRGMREKHERPDGYSVSRSKTIAVPLARLYAAWQDGRVRARWLGGGKLAVSTATANKSLRGRWDGGPTRLEVQFQAKGRGKSQVVVQHDKLPDARAAERMKSFWSERLQALKQALEA